MMRLKSIVKKVLDFKKPLRIIVGVLVALAVILSVGSVVNRVTDNGKSGVDAEANNQLTVADVEKISVGTQVDDVHKTLGEPNWSLSGFWGDVYDLGDDRQTTIYYNTDGKVEEIRWSISDSWYGSLNDKQMTLDDVRELAKKGDDLVFGDLAGYRGGNLSSNFDYYIMVYGVEGGFRLVVHSKADSKPDVVNLENVWESGGSGIDIRYGDLDGFLSKYPVVMWVKESSVTPTGVTAVLRNISNNDGVYGGDYILRFKDNDKGYFVDIDTVIENYGFNDIGYELKAGETAEVDIDWEWLYGELPPGDYKLVKDVISTENSGKNKKYTLSAVFFISDYFLSQK